MFMRTRRLTLRPGWIEDAAELASAIGHWPVVSNLARAPWPYALGDAQAYLAVPRVAGDVGLLVCDHVGGVARIVGGVGVHPAAESDGRHELGYWITPDCWGRGYATEAARAAIEIARMLGARRIAAGHFLDNPASGAVLRKLGFTPTGVAPRHARGRGAEVACAEFELTLDAPRLAA